MVPGQLIAPGQLTDPRINFALVHGLMPVTVHMSLSMPRDNKSSCKRKVTLAPWQFTVPGSCEQAFNFGNILQ